MTLRTLVVGVIAAAAAGFTVVSHAQQPSRHADWAIAIEPLASPAGTGTSEPQFSAGGGRTILSWLEIAGTHTTLKFAERSATGWSAVQSAAEGNDFMVNAADVPAVRWLADGSLAAAWLRQDGPDPESYTLELSTSMDAGRTWSKPQRPHHDSVHTQHGFASMFQAPGAGLGIVWLDGRAIKPDAPEGAGNMALRAALFDVKGNERPETVIDSRVCECCSTAAAATSEGIVVAYRDRTANEIRDISVTRLVNGRWSPGITVHADGWQIEGCPVNGPAISASGRDVAVAWFTAKGDQGHTFVAFSHDAGRTFGAPARTDEASSDGRVGVEMLSDGSAIVTWVESSLKPPAFMARRVGDRGVAGPSVAVGESTGTRIPRIARLGDEILFAWTVIEGSTPHVNTARARLR